MALMSVKINGNSQFENENCNFHHLLLLPMHSSHS
jgi:hypothetical protein